ncbi:ALG6, ALG8 glycosyltransferase family-domain-containing protein [Cerioporus squamosus]|nr:ALG6, ALG8 glycosyltransferase family-domain-containing protein [Cerioporus squamosus]
MRCLDTLCSSETDRSEIVAPVPRRHHILQTESRHWLGTPPLSPYSPPTSPLSATATSPARNRKRISQTLSLNSLSGHDPRRVPSAAHPPSLHLHKEHKSEDDRSMARRWLRWMHQENMKAWIVPSLVLASIWVKWAVGLGSYSGQGTPPMYGDYEAQRHWMELTIHLSTRQWYTYDLQYWGLDYPPLTAYVSWLCGIVGSWIDPSWFALDKSRGIESPSSKVFMRATVLFFDTLVYVPALVMFAKVWQGTRSSRTQNLALVLLLLQPALILIDFGHFQYNSVMLGFTLLAMNFFATGQDLLGAICFTLSLGFKQMALYYAPAIGILPPGKVSKLFVRLGIVTVASFIVLFLPFLPPFAPLSAILDPITRIFPFNRGLFEDKVANFWCASNVVLKWKLWVPQGALIKLSTALTAFGFLPAVMTLLFSGYKLRMQPGTQDDKTRQLPPTQTPILPLLPYALLTSSLSFFLFSFQVHEKTILVPLLPMTLLLSGSSPDELTFELGMLMNNVAVFSMWPLLKRDGLGVQYIALLVLWNKLIGYNPFRTSPRSFIRLLSLAVYTACFVFHIAELLITPPTRLPDIFSVLNVLISTPVFALVWLWSIKRGIEVSWALGGLGSRSKASQKPASGSTAAKPLQFSLEGGADGEAHGSTSENMLPRASGMRTMSLGFAQGRRRKMPRSGSVDIH